MPTPKWVGIKMGNKRKIIIIAVIGLCVVLVVLLTFRHQSPKRPMVTSTASHKVLLGNAGQYLSQISQPDLKEIELTLYDKLIATLPTSGVAGSYTGVVRQGSYQQTSNLYSDGVTQVPAYSFMVDIPGAKRSFSVALSGGPQYPFDTLYVLCPSPDQTIYPVFNCQDPGI